MSEKKADATSKKEAEKKPVYATEKPKSFLVKRDNGENALLIDEQGNSFVISSKELEEKYDIK